MKQNIFSGKSDVYIEVAKRYEKYIRAGVLKDGDKLPSVRTAADELNVNPNTVQKAYAYLEEQGLIKTLPKKGAFVTYQGNLGGDAQNRLNSRIIKSLSEYKEQGVSYDEMARLLKEVYKND